ncbi:MAG: TPM domain-containing protein [Pseudomonadota bacterium]
MAQRPHLTEEDAARIAAVVGKAEQQTSAEIRIVVTESPLVARSHYVGLWAALVALVAPWLAVFVVPVSSVRLLAAQGAVFVVAWALFSLPPVARRLVPLRQKRIAARTLAHQMFLAHGVHRTGAQTGVLILVAPHDRLVEVIADEAAHKALGTGTWEDICNAISGPSAEGKLADGVVAGVELAARLLAGPLPAQPGDRNELPDAPISPG